MLLAVAGCGDHGLFPSTVDPGPDFSVSEVVFDQGFFYCRVEPVLFQSGCGPGNPAAGDPRTAAIERDELRSGVMNRRDTARVPAT